MLVIHRIRRIEADIKLQNEFITSLYLVLEDVRSEEKRKRIMHTILCNIGAIERKQKLVKLLNKLNPMSDATHNDRHEIFCSLKRTEKYLNKLGITIRESEVI